MPEKYWKIPINWLKNQLKAYLIRYHDYPTEKYVDRFLRVFLNDTIHIFEKILGYGAVLYICLLGLLNIFPILQGYIWLGTMNVAYILAIIFSLGLITLVIKQSYEWKRGVMK